MNVRDPAQRKTAPAAQMPLALYQQVKDHVLRKIGDGSLGLTNTETIKATSLTLGADSTLRLTGTMNTGEPLTLEWPPNAVVAENSVLHEQGHASRVIAPVIK